MGLLYYLFSAHNWGLRDLKELWEGKTAWHDLILAMSSYEASERRPNPRRKPAIKLTKAKK